MRLSAYSHNSGDELLPQQIADEVRSALRHLQVRLDRYTAAAVRKSLLGSLQRLGWSGRVRLHPESQISVTSMKQGVALCLQTGNMARFYADLLKLQLLFVNQAIDGALFIAPVRCAATTMGSNLTNFERLTKELALFDRVITVPILVLGFQE